MTLKRRDKLVYFRISEEEFEEILRACDQKGARSVSDFARAAIQEFIKGPGNPSEQQLADFLKGLQTMVDELKQSVQELVATVAAPAGGNAAPNREAVRRIHIQAKNDASSDK
jgi:hypothetical protein